MIDELHDKVIDWANDRNIILGSTQQAQLAKLGEEFGELCRGVNKGNDAEIDDAIGDMVVVLSIIAAQNSTDLEECLQGAYDQIKHRTGQMVQGVFVKDE